MPVFKLPVAAQYFMMCSLIIYNGSQFYSLLSGGIVRDGSDSYMFVGSGKRRTYRPTELPRKVVSNTGFGNLRTELLMDLQCPIYSRNI